MVDSAKPSLKSASAPEAPTVLTSGEMRVLLMSHMDPRLSNGGAEIAALQLFQELERHPGIRPFFLSCAPGKIEARDGVTFAQPFDSDSYVYTGRGFDHFIFSNPDQQFPGQLSQLLEEIRPDVIHLHHYTNFGVETLQVIRRTLPNTRIVMTLHEYLAICNHFGQMIKRPSFRLCEKAGPRECSACFPEHSPQDFFMRELFLKRFFRLVDHFISPSQFLAERYAAWGIARDRISVIENGVPTLEKRGTLPYPSLNRGVTFGFFGQISRLKGINVILDAADQLLESDDPIRIEVHGDYSSQPEQFQREFQERLAAAPKNFNYLGPYDNKRVDRLMQSVHAVLVPSIWWENSPLVIQEALANRRPVICSDIGGMAEKVQDGLSGFHFQAGSGWALAGLMRRLAADPELLTAAHHAIPAPPGVASTTKDVLAVYRNEPADKAAGHDLDVQQEGGNNDSRAY